MNRQPARVLTLLSLVVAPLILASIELFHPAHFTHDPGMSNYLLQPQPYDPQFKAIAYFGPQWWFLMHMLQTPLVIVVSLGLLALTDAFGGGENARGAPLAWISRISAVVFMTYYTVLDSIGGIGLGRELIVLNEMVGSGTLSAAEAEKVRFFLDRMWVDPWVGGVGSVVSQTGSWAVFVAAVSAAGYLVLNRRASWLAFVLLIGFGWELQLTHASYHGPIAFSLLALASALILMRKDAGAGGQVVEQRG